jgi:IS30 family transposase
VLEAMNGVPTGLPRGARARQRQVVRLRAEGYSLRRIASTLAIARGTVEADLARHSVVADAGASRPTARGSGIGAETAARRRRNVLLMTPELLPASRLICRTIGPSSVP